MSTYNIKSITGVTPYPEKAYNYWRKAQIVNVNDSSDTMWVNLNPHAINEASAVFMIDDVPHANYVFRFKEGRGKTLDRWEENDIIEEL